MTFPEVNLARRPFANSRPVVRISIGLWVIGAVLVLFNVFLYGRSLAGMEEMDDRIEATREAIVEERERIAEAEESLRAMDLREQNEVAAYLNDRIDERTFPWSRLFDHLAEVLPREVRLHNLRPRRFESKGRRVEQTGSRGNGSERAAAEAEELVGLSMTGQARDDEPLLELLDNLFASGWFEDPQLASETREADDTLRFQLSATYLPATIRARRAPDASFAAVEDLLPDEAGRVAVQGGVAVQEGDTPGDEIGADRAAGPSTPGAPRASETPSRSARSPSARRTAPPRARTGEPVPPTETTSPEATGRAGASRDSTAVPTPIRPSASRPGGSR